MSAPGAALLTRPPAESGGRSLAAQLLLALICGGYAVGAALGWGSSEIAEIMGDFGLSAAGILAAVSCYSYARSIDRRERPAWLLFAFSSLMGACGNAVWGWYEVVLGEPVPKPSLADFAFLCFAPPAIVGLLVLAKRPVTRAGWVCLGLDSWLIGGSLLTLSWSLALANAARTAQSGATGSVPSAAISLAYPLLDIALVSMVLVLHFRRSEGNRSAVNTAIAALALTVLSDALFTSPLLSDGYQSDSSTPAGSPARCCSRTRRGRPAAAPAPARRPAPARGAPAQLPHHRLAARPHPVPRGRRLHPRLQRRGRSRSTGWSSSRGARSCSPSSSGRASALPTTSR
ncbi:hypothetical protein GCM10020254_28590 [Streptomyces goshikiensis]